jgi:hypothetical protein
MLSEGTNSTYPYTLHPLTFPHTVKSQLSHPLPPGEFNGEVYEQYTE